LCLLIAYQIKKRKALQRHNMVLETDT